MLDRVVLRAALNERDRRSFTAVSPQVFTLDDTCVEHGCQWLHYVCTDATLRELVAVWHGLAPEVREEMRELVRGG